MAEGNECKPSQADIIAAAVANMLRDHLAPLSTLKEDVASIKNCLVTLDDRVKAVEETTSAIPRLRSQMDTGILLQGHSSLTTQYDEHRQRDIDIELTGARNSTEVRPITIDLENMNYDMSGKKILVIFSHRTFRDHTLEPRRGTEMDVKSLQQIFEELRFVVYIYTDLKMAALWEKLVQLRDQNHEGTSCLCVAFLTHGATGGVLYAADRQYEFKSVLELFENHKTLVNKPRVFIVQACRGHDMDYGTETTDNNCEEVNSDFTFVTPSHADFCVIHSTVEDFVSFRNVATGSWLIQTLCSVLEDNHNEYDLVHMAILIQKRVAYDFQSVGFDSTMQSLKQIPETTFTLTKFLKL